MSASAVCQSLLARGFELQETHISWVFLGTNTAFKVKKPVDLGFVDFTTLQKRREACEVEVRLNRRLAPDVYLGVSAVTRTASGHFDFDGDGEVIDWAVRMVRLRDEDRADVLLHEGKLTGNDLEGIARRLAAFHDQMPTTQAIAEFGSVSHVAANIRENFAQMRGQLDSTLTREEQIQIETAQLTFLRQNADKFQTRCERGRVRDGHGDLRLEHIYLDAAAKQVRILDCIEFNDRFRYADVCADVAFLAMDLAWCGRPDLAERFLAAYARAAQDYDLYGLIDFYESYRAYVRGKIASMVLSNVELTTDVRNRLCRDARRYFLLSLAAGRPPIHPPRLIAVGGIIGAGKSTVAEALGAALACPVVDTDRTRKHLANVAPNQSLSDRPFEGAYDLPITARVYAEVGRRASVVLASGRSVVVDASFRNRAERVAIRDVAERQDVPFLFLECRASEETCRQRLSKRAERPSVSDGRLEIFDSFVASWEPVRELSQAEHRVVNTEQRIGDAIALLG